MHVFYKEAAKEGYFLCIVPLRRGRGAKALPLREEKKILDGEVQTTIKL